MVKRQKLSNAETEGSRFVFNMASDVKCRCGEDKFRVFTVTEDSKVTVVKLTCVSCGNVIGGRI